jgi:hypothetical protein
VLDPCSVFRHEPRLRLAAASAGPSGSGALPRPVW